MAAAVISNIMQYEIRYINIQVWFKCENGLQKKLFIEKKKIFSVDYVKIN